MLAAAMGGCMSTNHGPAGNGHAMRERIELQRPGLQRRLRGLGGTAAQHRLDPRFQLAGRKRLGHVIVDPGLETGDLVALFRSCGDHDDGELARTGISPKLSRKRQTRLTRQHPVEQHEVGQLLLQRFVRRLGVRRRLHLVTGVHQVDLDELEDRRFVFDDEDRRHHRCATSARICCADECRTSLPFTTCTTASAMFLA